MNRRVKAGLHYSISTYDETKWTKAHMSIHLTEAFFQDFPVSEHVKFIDRLREECGSRGGMFTVKDDPLGGKVVTIVKGRHEAKDQAPEESYDDFMRMMDEKIFSALGLGSMHNLNNFMKTILRGY